MNSKILGAFAVALVVALAVITLNFIPGKETVKKLPKLRVLAYSSFVSTFGPAQDLKESFEASCDCEVEFVNGGDSAVMVQKLHLRKDGFQPDIVIGLDQWTLPLAQERAEWRVVELNEVDWVDGVHPRAGTRFIPFDWAPLTFIYRQGEVEPPTRLDDLLSDSYSNSITLQDPRSSTPGQQFFYWIHSLKGDETFDFLKRLQGSVHSVSPSWSSSYGLFKKKQASLTFSYATSVVYHWKEEKDRSYQAASLPEGHPYQIEFAGVPASCKNCDLAAQFVAFLIEPEAQEIIMHKNFMLPVVEGVTKGSLFSEVPQLKLLSVSESSQAEFTRNRDDLLKKWIEVFRQ